VKQQTQATSHVAFKIFLLAFFVARCLKEDISTIAIPTKTWSQRFDFCDWQA
jgi:hypothetical protein